MSQRAPGFFIQEVPPHIFFYWRVTTILRLMLTQSFFTSYAFIGRYGLLSSLFWDHRNPDLFSFAFVFPALPQQSGFCLAWLLFIRSLIALRLPGTQNKLNFEPKYRIDNIVYIYGRVVGKGSG